MEKMPFRDQPDRPVEVADRDSWQALPGWRSALPLLTGRNLVLREVRPSDAPSLLSMLSAEVTRFISPPPTTLDGFQRFIAWSQRQRTQGAAVCFGVVPDGFDDAVGVFQVRQLEPGFGTAEWGFVLGCQFWGRGVFAEAAPIVADFAFDVLRAHRLEARAVVADGRGNGALRKIGAVQETVLRGALSKDGRYLDQYLWAILDDDWRSARPRFANTFTVH